MNQKLLIGLATIAALTAAAVAAFFLVDRGQTVHPVRVEAQPTDVSGETIALGAGVAVEAALLIIASEPATKAPIEKWVSSIAKVPGTGDLYLATVQEVPSPDVQNARLVLMQVRDSATEFARTDAVPTWALESSFIETGGRLLVMAATNAAGQHTGYEVFEIANRNSLRRLGSILIETPEGTGSPLDGLTARAKGDRVILRFEGPQMCWSSRDNKQPQPMSPPVLVAVGQSALEGGPCTAP